MDAVPPKTSNNLSQNELDRAKAQWTAEKARRIAENEALNRIQPGDSSGSYPSHA